MPAFLLPLLLNLAPTVAGWIMGDKTGQAVGKVTDIVKSVTGTEGDPAAALQANPDLVLQLKEALIRAESEEKERQHQEVLAQLADVQSARNQTVELAKTHSPIAWGAPVVSILAVGVFGGFVYGLFIAHDLPDGMKDALMLMAGSAAAGFGAVLNYWLGSSSGSASKDQILSAIARKP